MKWRDDKSNLTQVVDEAIHNKRLISAKCCDNPETHVFGYVHRNNRGSAWGWCSHCGAFVHLDGVTFPQSWKNVNELPLEMLYAVPINLEERKAIIDKHMAEFLKS